MLRIMLAAIVALGAFLVFEARADASPYVQYGIQDDAWLLGGPGTFDERLDQVDALGADVVRVNLRWDEIAAKREAAAAAYEAYFTLRGTCERIVERLRQGDAAPSSSAA